MIALGKHEGATTGTRRAAYRHAALIADATDVLRIWDLLEILQDLQISSTSSSLNEEEKFELVNCLG